VERSNSIIKRILIKLIFSHADRDNSNWSEYLDQTVKLYNFKINSTAEVKTAQTVKYELEDNKDGLLKQNFRYMASEYIHEGLFILPRRPYLVWSCQVMGAFSVFTGADYLCVSALLSQVKSS